MARDLKNGEILMLENLRFQKGEENPEKDPLFAKNLSKLADIYVNDAFAVFHRKHSSVYTICKFFKNKSLAGLLLEKEIDNLEKYIKTPKRPFYAIIGGAKVSTKIGLILKLLEKVDSLFIGGGMSYTFFKAQGFEIGNSIFEEKEITNIKKALKISKDKNIDINLPKDIIIADSFSNDANFKIISSKENIPKKWQGMDIGPKTLNSWELKLKKAKTIFWNGPLGVFEMKNFSKGTNKIAKILANSEANTIIGGGDSLYAVNKLNLSDKFTHLSTGGGACLEYIEYGTLPGMEVLSEKPFFK